MNNSVAKNDKKRRKHLGEEVCKLEAEMDVSPKEELEQFSGKDKDEAEVESAANGIEKVTLDGTESTNQPPRITKAQKRRDKKAALEKERNKRIAEAEIENLSGARHLESQQLSVLLAARNLKIKQIASDGHCMYRAVEDQVKPQGNGWTVSSLRIQTAEYMRKHVSDFLPFSTNPNTGDMYTPDAFEKYCDDIVNTPAWGGQLEQRALSHVLQTPIEVIQADSAPIVVGEEYSNEPIILVYMRHAYGLGEHYNSVEKLKDTVSENS
ncbi:deubiquitinase OTUD6B isoform X2 [Ambystoma mexicanum]|uniref:deubiquitinase OTUD6B isoform X2 n=1 Tax=Ambystoma mexicanum TaxID=8296 RepID=UPI0037E96D53